MVKRGALSLARVWRRGPGLPSAVLVTACCAATSKAAHHRLVQADVAAARSAGGARWAWPSGASEPPTRSLTRAGRSGSSSSAPKWAGAGTRQRSGRLTARSRGVSGATPGAVERQSHFCSPSQQPSHRAVQGMIAGGLRWNGC